MVLVLWSAESLSVDSDFISFVSFSESTAVELRLLSVELWVSGRSTVASAFESVIMPLPSNVKLRWIFGWPTPSELVSCANSLIPVIFKTEISDSTPTGSDHIESIWSYSTRHKIFLSWWNATVLVFDGIGEPGGKSGVCLDHTSNSSLPSVDLALLLLPKNQPRRPSGPSIVGKLSNLTETPNGNKSVIPI